MSEKSLAESPKLVLASVDMPMSIEDAKNLMDSYQKLCAALLVPWEARVIKNGVLTKDSDYQRIKVKTKDEKGLDIWIDRDFVKKSGWRKLATALRLNLEIVSKAREEKPDGVFVYRYEVKTTSPGGRSTVGVGKCSSLEAHTKGREENDVEATAYTRAANRAISDLIGFGQTSAEELEEPPRKVVESEASVKPEVPPVKSPEQPVYKPRRFDKPSAADEAQGNAASFIADTLQEAGLDPDGVEVSSRDWGLFEVRPIVKMESDTWQKYHQALKPLKAEYHSKVKKMPDDPDDPYAGSWTVKVER